ncbi:hypothetical protein BC829DRAFT_451322, partial [Chytridium lagenaria]
CRLKHSRLLPPLGSWGIAFRAGLKEFQKFENDGKPKRFGVDRWDRRMMERDSRLTGNVNVQSAQSQAPESFKVNSAWEVERPFYLRCGLLRFTNIPLGFRKPITIKHRSFLINKSISKVTLF